MLAVIKVADDTPRKRIWDRLKFPEDRETHALALKASNIAIIDTRFDFFFSSSFAKDARDIACFRFRVNLEGGTTTAAWRRRKMALQFQLILINIRTELLTACEDRSNPSGLLVCFGLTDANMVAVCQEKQPVQVNTRLFCFKNLLHQNSADGGLDPKRNCSVSSA